MYIPTASEDSGRFDCKHQKIKSNEKYPQWFCIAFTPHTACIARPVSGEAKRA